MLSLLILAISMVSLVAAKCPSGSGAHIVVARGSEEPHGPGILGPIAQQIQQLVPGSDIEPLDYPALYQPYNPSQIAGVQAMTTVVREYADKCPDTEMIILGYSQGAHVAMDTFCGASSPGFPESAPQPSYISDKVAAIIVMGDPSLTEGQPFTVGSSHGSGIFPRVHPEGCDQIARKVISICDAGDPFCEAGSKDVAVHLSYVAVWDEYIVSHAAAMFQSA
ncbi:hypothetical protein ACHAPT_000390 [Fusarium lateritium]